MSQTIQTPTPRRPRMSRGSRRWSAVVVLAISVMAPNVPMPAGAVQPQRSQATWEVVSLDALPGRWVARPSGGTFDIVRCGEGWCGIRVKDDMACGDVALRLRAITAQPQFQRLQGTFDRRAGGDTHAVHGNFYRHVASGVLTISMVGSPGTELQLWRRTFPYSGTWARISDATCTTQDKLS